MTPEEKRNTILMIVATAIIVVLMIWGETYSRQRKQFWQGEKYYQEKNYQKAITAYESALHMYTPLSGKIKTSAERLWDIGRHYEGQQDYDMALIAYRSLRSSFYACRSFYTPYPEWIEKCEVKIDELVQKQMEHEKLEKERLKQENEKAMEEEPVPGEQNLEEAPMEEAPSEGGGEETGGE